MLETMLLLFVFPDLIHKQNNQRKSQEVTVQRKGQQTL